MGWVKFAGKIRIDLMIHDIVNSRYSQVDFVSKDSVAGVAKYAVDANLFPIGSSILKHAGPRGAAHWRVWG